MLTYPLAATNASRRAFTSLDRKPTVSLSARTKGTVRVIRASGEVNRDTAGQFCDALVAAVRRGSSAVVLDFSGITTINRSGTRGLIVADKLMQAARREMRLAGATGQVRAPIEHVGHSHLLKLDRTVAEAVAKLAPSRHLKLPQIDRVV